MHDWSYLELLISEFQENHQFHPCLPTGREDEEVIEKILKHLGLLEMKARPPPKPKASLVTMHFDYSDSQISFADSFYADPHYPIDSYLS